MSRPVNSVTVSRSKRGTTVKASGSAAQALFDALTQGGQADRELKRLEGLRTVAHVLHFEDHGQDFLRWDIDAAGVVIDAHPYQADVWKGCLLLNAPEVGERVRFFSARTKREMTLAYPVAKVELHLLADKGTEPSP